MDLKTKADYSPSEAFEYPHFYVPTPLAQDAAKELQNRLEKELPHLKKEAKGRMFGVLVVETSEKEVQYLAAYSGELQQELESISFVPPVFQLPKGEDFPEMSSINAISREIKVLEKDEDYLSVKADLLRIEKESKENIQAAKKAAKESKKERDELRKHAQNLSKNEGQELLDRLSKEGADAGMDLRRFTRSENLRLKKAEEAFKHYEDKITTLKILRRSKSAELQEEIFRSYVLQNSFGEKKDVKRIFNDFGVDIPPAGAGECAAPKLFQYAFQYDLKPIALAEFWWGTSPDSQIREHGNFYPACKGKCQPILSFMLDGIPVKPNPLLENFGADKELEILFEDPHFIVINKPFGMLSVPGKHIIDSVQTRIEKKYPEASGPLIVHRLDQDTSGIMIIALSKEAHKLLQKQFLERSIHKTYLAILEKAIDASNGIIELPLILDVNNRPMQMVSYEYGKAAMTHFEVVKKTSERTLIQLKPITGRSHQLRVHCAHILGLHAPILGDNLYGHRSERLYLHAQEIEFSHPFKNEQVKVQTKAPFSI